MKLKLLIKIQINHYLTLMDHHQNQNKKIINKYKKHKIKKELIQ
jgi:hypothetical protein